MSEKKYYTLFVNTILFVQGDKAASHTMNGMSILDSPLITRKVLAQAQQAAQIGFLKEMTDDKNDLKIVSVVINNIVPLGHMTAEEFNAGYENG